MSEDVFFNGLCEDHTEFLKLLLAFGAHPDLRNNKGSPCYKKYVLRDTFGFCRLRPEAGGAVSQIDKFLEGRFRALSSKV
jgi:hypothetical protein